MSQRDQQYCDDCGDPLRDKSYRSYTELPFNVASANKGESAVLCLTCNYRRINEMSPNPEGPPYWSVYISRKFHGCRFDSEARLVITLQSKTLEDAIQGAKDLLKPMDNDCPWVVTRVIPVDGPEGA